MDEPPAQSADADAGDLELLRLIEHGDRRAFRELYSQYYRRLWRFLGRLTTDGGLAEEIIDDTLMVVWRKAGQFDGRSRVSTWIFGIAYRVAIKAFARRPAAPPEPRENLTDLDQQIPSLELGELLELALRRLSPEHRAVLELAYVAGYSCAEIAAVVGCPVNTVKTRLFHARERVREVWPELTGEPPARLEGKE